MKTLQHLHNEYIKGTTEKEIIILTTTLLCNTTNLVTKAINLPSSKVYITTRVVKHLYDSKPAEEYDFIVNNLEKIVRYPDQIYENKGGKRGQFCFLKKIKDDLYFCSFEVSQMVVSESEVEEVNFVVTAFRIRRPSYLKDYKLLWDRKGGKSSS